MSVEWYDRERFEQEWAADQDVLDRLREQGDKAQQPRPLDVSFRGDPDRLAVAEGHAPQHGFDTIQLVELDNGEWRLDVSRRQTAEAQAIRELTITALQIEAASGVIYDGWGCITQNDKA